MKRKTYFILLFLVTPFLALSQKSVLDIEMKGGKAQEVYSINDSYGNMAYIFQGTKSFQITLLDIEFKITKEFLISRGEAEKKNELIGVTINNQNVVLYLYNYKEKSFATLIVDRFNGNHNFKPSIGSLNKTEHLLKAFEMEDVFYVMAIPQHKNEVILLSSKEGSDFSIANHEIAFPTFFAKLSTGNEKINQGKGSEVGIEKINYIIENDIQTSYPSKKMYTFGNKIYMTFEEPAHTHLIIIDPISNNSVYRKLNFSLDKGKNKTPNTGNSFLFKGDLFRITMNKDQLNLIIINLDSMHLLKNYNLYPDMPIPILNGSIVEESQGRDSKIVKNTQAFFKKIQRGELSIAVNELRDGNYETEIGAYEEITVYRNSNPMGGGFPIGNGLSIGIGMGMGMGMGGIGIGSMGMGGLGMGYGGFPNYSPYGNGYSTTTINSVYFKSLLSIDDLSHVPGAAPRTVKDKIKEYEENVLRNNSPEAINVLPSYTGIVLGYYAKGRSRYNLVEFLK